MKNDVRRKINFIDIISENITLKVNTHLNKGGLELEKMKYHKLHLM